MHTRTRAHTHIYILGWIGQRSISMWIHHKFVIIWHRNYHDRGLPSAFILPNRFQLMTSHHFHGQFGTVTNCSKEIIVMTTYRKTNIPHYKTASREKFVWFHIIDLEVKWNTKVISGMVRVHETFTIFYGYITTFKIDDIDPNMSLLLISSFNIPSNTILCKIRSTTPLL